MKPENPTPCTQEGKCSTRWPVHYADVCERGSTDSADALANRDQTPVHLVSFASSDYAPSLRRLARQAEAIATFASITTTTEKDLEPSFRAKFSEYLQPGVRGFGYWMWKPEIILRTLERIPEGEVLLYMDAGCHLNPAGRARLSSTAPLRQPLQTIPSSEQKACQTGTIRSGRHSRRSRSIPRAPYLTTHQ
jgi:hypothetical protein